MRITPPAPGLADVVNVKTFGAMGDGVTNDTNAFNVAVAVAVGTGRTLYVPPSPTPYLIPNGLALSEAHGLTIMGYGATLRTTAVDVPALRTRSEAPANRYATDPNITWYTLASASSPFRRGASSVTLASAGDGVNFAAGDYIWIRARGLVAGAEATTPLAEMNVVASVAGAVINLVHPLAKEYTYDAARLYAVGKVNRYCHDLTIAGLTLRNVSDRVLLLTQVFNCNLRDLKLYGSSGVHIRGRFVRAENIYIEIVPNYTSQYRPYVIALDTGTSDVVITNLQAESTGLGILHIHEACANVRIQGAIRNGATDTGTAENWPAISVRALSWDVDLDLDVTNSPRGGVISSYDSTIYVGEGNKNLRWRGAFSGTILAGYGIEDVGGIGIDTTEVVAS